MILNVSGRTDVVAFYTKWFINRLEEGFVDVRNPFYQKSVSRIYFHDVDLIFFCTKNPLPIIPYLPKIKKKMYFHITLTPYKKEIEPNVPFKKEIMLGIKKISQLLGKENVVIRYDPVLISPNYTIEYHIKAFTKICTELDGYVNKIVLSFLDEYKNVKKNKHILNYIELKEEDYRMIGTNFSKIAKEHHMVVHTCFEEHDLTEYGFIKDECMSRMLAYQLTGKIYKEEWRARKEKKCHCVSMVDIGVYNSCKHFCHYCYANYDEKKVMDNISQHDPNSSLLIGKLESDDIIKERYK